MPRLMSTVLNEKEKRVLAAFPTEKDEKDAFQYVTLSELAGKAFNKRGTAPKTKGNSWVRNSMRKLLSLKLVQMKGSRSGSYRLTGKLPPEPRVEAEAVEAEANGVKKNVTPKKSTSKKKAKKAKSKSNGRAKAKVESGDGDEGEDSQVPGYVFGSDGEDDEIEAEAPASKDDEKQKAAE